MAEVASSLKEQILRICRCCENKLFYLWCFVNLWTFNVTFAVIVAEVVLVNERRTVETIDGRQCHPILNSFINYIIPFLSRAQRTFSGRFTSNLFSAV